MNAQQAADEIARLYPQVYRLLHTRWGKDEYRPSSEALAVLQHLVNSGPLTVTEAARHFDRAQSAMSEMIERMTAQGLLERMADSRDKRRTLVWLSETGLALLRKSEGVLDAQGLREAVAAMGSDDRASLLRGLQALVDAARGITHHRGANKHEPT